MATKVQATTDESILATGSRQVDARDLKAGDQIYEHQLIDTEDGRVGQAVLRTVKHVEPAPESGTVLVVYAGGAFADFEPDEVVTVVEPAEPTEEQARANARANGLRQLADMVQANPDLRFGSYSFGHMLVPVGDDADARERILAYVEPGRAAGGDVVDYDGGAHAGVLIKFGPVQVQVYCSKGYLADEPPPTPPPAYRPLLSNFDGDQPAGGAS